MRGWCRDSGFCRPWLCRPAWCALCAVSAGALRRAGGLGAAWRVLRLGGAWAGVGMPGVSLSCCCGMAAGCTDGTDVGVRSPLAELRAQQGWRQGWVLRWPGQAGECLICACGWAACWGEVAVGISGVLMHHVYRGWILFQVHRMLLWADDRVCLGSACRMPGAWCMAPFPID